MSNTPKKKKVRIEKDGKFYTARGVELTRNGQTLTESQYFAKILSALRGTTRYWVPAMQALKEVSRPSQSSNKRLKTEYLCKSCMNWYPRKSVQIDHIIPCGGINGYDKIVPWLLKAHIEDVKGFQVLCIECHKAKTIKEKEKNEI